jgi:hypothetical protein
MRLHLAPRGLELLGYHPRPLEGDAMKNLFFAALLAATLASLAGCSACRNMCGGWFNRGDRCNDCPPADCAPGMPRATMMYPSSAPQVLPGPIEIAPTN